MTIVGRAVDKTAASSEDKRDVMDRAAMMALLDKLACIRRKYGSRELESGACLHETPIAKRKLGFEACHRKPETNS